MLESRRRTKRETEFILKIFSVYETFEYKGIKFLSYISTPQGGDEFLIRDNIIKSIFTGVLNYDNQKDFVPEESIESGKPDTQILDANNHTFIVIETLSSNASKAQFYEHRVRLFSYTKELDAKYAILTNGIIFEAYRCIDGLRMINLNLLEIYRKFIERGIDAIPEEKLREIIKLRFFAKERWLYKPEEIFKEPELDVAQDAHFNNFIDELKESMDLVKEDVLEQFEHLVQCIKELKKGTPVSKKKTEYQEAKKLEDSINKWQKISSPTSPFIIFQLETMYVFFNRILLLRICEDKQIIPKRFISNGGIKGWLSFRGWINLTQIKYDELLKVAYTTMESIYPHLFREDIFDWYIPDNEVLRKVLFTFNFYNFKNVDKDILGRLYQEYISSEERKRLGQFYTPEPIIDYILNAVGYNINSEIEGKLLLDPACGSGGFLVRATNILVTRLRSRGFDAETILGKVQESILGFEINPFACHLAETNLLFQVVDLIKEAKFQNSKFTFERFNIFQTDSLKIPEIKEKQLFPDYTSYLLEDAEIVKQIKMKRDKFKNGIDFVVGNPPYVSYGLRGVGKIAQEEQKYLLKNYPDSAEYKISLYAIFINMGIRQLKENGKLGYIIPDSFLLGRYFSKLRRYILNSCKINEIVLFEKDFWESGVVGRPVITVFERASDDTIRKNNNIEAKFCSMAKKKLKELKFTSFSYNQIYFETVHHNRFRLFFNQKDKALISKLEKNNPVLKGVINIASGLIGKEGKKKIISSIKVNNMWYPGITSGESLNRYSINYKNEYILFDIDKLHSGFKEAKYFEPKILLRQTADTITAAYDNDNLLCLNNIHVGNLLRQDYDLRYVLALLNSKLMNYYYRLISLESGRIMAQTDIDMIEELPIKFSNKIIQKKIVSYVDEILKINNTLYMYEKRVNDFQTFLKEFKFTFGDLADIPDVKIQLKEHTSIPNIKRENLKVYVSLDSYIECANDNLAEYIELYLLSIKSEIRGKSRPEIVKLIKIPKSLNNVKDVLSKRDSILNEIIALQNKRIEIDSRIDEIVYDIYVLTQEEIRIIENFNKKT